MGQLECSEIKLSYLSNISDVFRLDSFFFSKKFLNEENIIAKHNNLRLIDMCTSLRSFGAYSLNNYVEYQTEGIPFIRGVNMKNGILDFSDVIYITEEANRLLWKSEVHPEDILLTMSGTIGDVAIAMPSLQYPLNSNQDIAKIHLKDNFNPYFVYTFLLSKFGQNYLTREARGSVQQHVFLSQMENFVIPLLPDSFQSRIADMVKSAHSKLEESKMLYHQAEEILEKELGIDYDAIEQKKDVESSVRSFKDVFCDDMRIDSEYYLTRYDELLKQIKGVEFKSINQLQTFNRRGLQPEYYADGSIDVVNSKHILEDGLYYDNFEKTSELFYSKSPQAWIFRNDILTYTTGANIGRTQVYLSDAKAVASNHVNILRVNSVNPIYLAFVLNSKVGRMQTDKYCSGTAQVELYPDVLGRFIVPILNVEIQSKIASLVQLSTEKKAESKQLLEDAKRLVEEEIEKGDE